MLPGLVVLAKQFSVTKQDILLVHGAPVLFRWSIFWLFRQPDRSVFHSGKICTESEGYDCCRGVLDSRRAVVCARTVTNGRSIRSDPVCRSSSGGSFRRRRQVMAHRALIYLRSELEFATLSDGSRRVPCFPQRTLSLARRGVV